MKNAEFVAMMMLLMACVQVWEPNGLQRFDPPPIYEKWWAATKECSGLSGDYRKVEWYVVPGEMIVAPTGEMGKAWWVEPHRIYVATLWVKNEHLIRHEMLHELLQVAGHHWSAFERCGV